MNGLGECFVRYFWRFFVFSDVVGCASVVGVGFGDKERCGFCWGFSCSRVLVRQCSFVFSFAGIYIAVLSAIPKIFKQ